MVASGGGREGEGRTRQAALLTLAGERRAALAPLPPEEAMYVLHAA